MNKRKVIIVAGQTATGKSSIAVALAKKFGGEVISADSRQVYKGLDIGSGKITKKEMAGVRHYMLSLANPKKRFSAADFQKRARKNLEEIFARGKVPIICGGTGFYISALIDQTAFPDVPPDPILRARLEQKSAGELFAILKKIDPLRAKNIDPRNKRRLSRAIEITKTLGAVPPKETGGPSEFSALWIGLRGTPSDIRTKINARLLSRLQYGMIAEVKRLHKKGLSWKRMEEMGLEYRYLGRYLRGSLTKGEMIRDLQFAIYHFAKRQLTWFKRDKRIKWFDCGARGYQNAIFQEAKKFLAQTAK